jgi:hypothetical protein
MQFQEHCHRDRPTLILGLLGFSREARMQVQDVLALRSDAPVRWRIGELSEADAWWASGSRAQLLADGSLRIGPADAGGRSVRLALDEVPCPVAFSEPLACRDFEPAYTFRTEDPASMAAMLATLETRWLGCTAARLWLAARLVESDEALHQRVYHLVAAGRLLAVVDRIEAVGFAPGVKLEDLEAAQWVGRPSSAAFIPPTFGVTTMSELLWSYAVRAHADLLPARYRSSPIYFRRPPKLPQRRLGDDHLHVMRELFAGPATFGALQRSTGIAPPQLARALAALYLTGSITSNPQRVPRPAGFAASHGSTSEQASVWSPTGQASGYTVSPVAPGHDFTMPARLPSERAALAGIAEVARAGGQA